MSDLIIKPSGTSANFKVQNPSGTDKIVMNSSGTITTATLGSSVTNNAGVASGTISSGVTFPTGQIIHTQYDSYDTQTSIGTTLTYIMSCSWATKGANSRILARANLHMGANSDLHGWYGGITLTTGTTASTNYDADALQANANDDSAGRLFADDLGNSHVNGYFTKDVSVAASKTTSYEKGTTIIVALYLLGVNTAYINRCANRATIHEAGVSTLTVYEIAT